MSPALQAGRGKAAPIGALSPTTYCALIVLETWKFLHGAEPLPGNKRAAEAAEALWRAAGGEAHEYGEEPRARWRYHFKTARRIPANDLRGEYKRHLIESERFRKLPIGPEEGA